ncbi:uncharacterized protein DNG_02921 [Cephalotrichum gorgonifer]|uniref:Bulb-type lectin domain-containing protein n=1 Tax=Cephalotrichum gorgonifer TaxID=2041049 RepID=A0AAE8MT99_9PEZI|nr:uncharacterized protein DNG_02921 [Cephalotrichum gorgonifer]
MLCRWHGFIPGKRFAPVTILLLLALVVFFLSSPTQLPDLTSLPDLGDDVRIPKPGTPAVTSPASTVAVEPESEPELPLPPKRTPAPGSTTSTSFIYPDPEGLVLSNKRPVLESPDGRSTLTLQRDGNLVLRSRGADGSPNILWSTGTGNPHAHAAGARVSITARAGDHMVLEVTAPIDGGEEVLWHSNLVPACTPHARTNSSSNTLHAGRLELSGSGRLTLAGACDLYVPTSEREESRSLAVILSGAYKRGACAQIPLGYASFSAIDVFASVFFEDSDDGAKAGIEAELRGCYGDALRSVEVSPAPEAAEEDLDRHDGRELERCHEAVSGMSGRLESLYDAGRAWWEWSVRSGVLHDTVLAMRADVPFGREGEAPGFRALEELAGKLVVVRDPGAGYLFCPRMTGGVGIAASEYITYGTPASMSHYLNLHATLPSVLPLALGAHGTAHRDFSGCGVVPMGPRLEDCPSPVPCAVECLVAWYLDSVGVDLEVDWWETG